MGWLRREKNLFEPEALENFKKGQRLAYQCAIDIASEMQLGWTERKTADLMDTYLKDYGVKAFFHRSFAWFGSRSSFYQFKSYVDFMPSDRVLNEDDIFILDTAPIVNGYVCDIGYTKSWKPDSEFLDAKKVLLEFRDKLPMYFSSALRTDEIWQKVDQEIKTAGYNNCHKEYPFGALGHTVHKVPFASLPGVINPFGVQAMWMFLSRGLTSEILGPKSKLDKTGLWAIEPHIGNSRFGAKFEEIMIVEPSGTARWLDDQVPGLLKEGMESVSHV